MSDVWSVVGRIVWKYKMVSISAKKWRRIMTFPCEGGNTNHGCAQFGLTLATSFEP